MKRGSSDHCLVVGIKKPRGMSSHDVVNRVRRVFGERRVGHTGTLDPLAEGVLPICVGPATRLDPHLTGHDKTYVVRIAFGMSTDTDDAEGEVLRRGAVPAQLEDPVFAGLFLAGMVGPQKQLPPVYSAIKVDGKKAYEQARKGNIIDMTPREIEVYEARLVEVGKGYALPGAGSHAQEGEASDVEGASGSEWCDLPWWDVEFKVSKGTYIRSLARDAGIALDCPAHVAALKRTASGELRLDECVTLEALETEREAAAVDPVRLLGYRFAFADGPLAKRVSNGAVLRTDELPLFVRRKTRADIEMCACTAGVCESAEPPVDGEFASVIVQNKLAAIYQFDGAQKKWRVSCVFQKGVSRGSCV